MKLLTSLFRVKKNTDPTEYGGFSAFLLNASKEEKKAVFKEAAYKANEEQRKVVKNIQTAH